MNLVYFLADAVDPKKKAQEGLTIIGGDSATTDNFNTKLQAVLNWIFGIIGIVAVIMIILGGFTMMTSSGDPGKVKKGKDTILYGVIGLVVALLAVV
ncbi:hypothetical protein IIZ81_00210, partial [Candidatus Saccharibacteria bacterium]|nr:hypothetical protein [Candidatus Saccharibacteria bacterium]